MMNIKLSILVLYGVGLCHGFPHNLGPWHQHPPARQSGNRRQPAVVRNPISFPTGNRYSDESSSSSSGTRENSLESDERSNAPLLTYLLPFDSVSHGNTGLSNSAHKHEVSYGGSNSGGSSGSSASSLPGSQSLHGIFSSDAASSSDGVGGSSGGSPNSFHGSQGSLGPFSSAASTGGIGGGHGSSASGSHSGSQNPGSGLGLQSSSPSHSGFKGNVNTGNFEQIGTPNNFPSGGSSGTGGKFSNNGGTFGQELAPGNFGFDQGSSSTQFNGSNQSYLPPSYK